MGTLLTYKCSKCGYNVMTSGGHDYGMLAVIGGSTLSLFYENKILFNSDPGKVDFDGKNI